MGQGVIWYTGQFYAQSFLENSVKLEFMQNREILLWAIALGTPFFVLFGWLSDRLGRKWIMLTGMLLGVLFYRPIFSTMLEDADVKKQLAGQVNFISQQTKVTQYNGDSVLHITAHYKTDNGILFSSVLTDTLKKQRDFLKEPQQVIAANKNMLFTDKQLPTALKWKFVLLIWVMIVFVTMVYGPVAAFLVELFPTKIRYTSMSLPYHIGNGVFGGLVPFIATLLSASFTTDPLVGLWYPIGVAALCFVIGALYLNNTIDKNVND
jgi:MFS family permease